MYEATPDQKDADKSVVVAACDTLLDNSLVSANGASKAWSWDYSFGAKIKGRYHCEADAAEHRINKMVLTGPFGDQRIL